MNIKAFVSPLLKYWWLIMIAAIVATVSSYLVTRQQPLIYQSKATLIVGRAFYEANPSGNDIYLGQQLANYYSDIGKRSEVSGAVQEALGLSWLPQYNINPLPNSQFLEIVVVDTNPARAQAVANELANQLILISPTSDQSLGEDRQAFISEQIVYLETKIRETLEEIDESEKQLSEMNGAREIADMRNKIAALQTKLSQLQTNYAALISNTAQGAVNTLRLIERASLPTRPIGPNNFMAILLSAVIAMAFAAAAAYLLEFLDDTFKTSDEVTDILQMPVLASVPVINSKVNSNGSLDGQSNKTRRRQVLDRVRAFPGKVTGKLFRSTNSQTIINQGPAEVEETDIFTYTLTHPRSAAAEEFRLLRINIDFAGVDRKIKRVFITSCDANEGKTSIAINLAIVMAQGGNRVILLDADLRHPSVNRYLKLENDTGLSDLLRYDLDVSSVMNDWEEPNLSVITTGISPPNPVDLLTSNKMSQVLQQIEDEADIVIIDGPPMVFPDTVALSSKVDGILMVVTHAYTRKGLAQKMLKQFLQVGARVIGVVFNKAPVNTMPYYHSFYYKQSGSEKSVPEKSVPEPEPEPESIN